MDSFKRFNEVAADPAAYAQNWKTAKGGKVVGSLCSYAPEEIILASGALGYRIFGTELAISRADAHMQAYSCSLVRGALEEVLAGRLDFLDGVVFPHTCDSIQRLSDIWRMNVKTGFHTDLVLPVKLDTDSARDYMTEVLKTFRLDLEAGLGKKISTADIESAVETCNRIRTAMRRIYTARIESPGILKGTDISRTCRKSCDAAGKRGGRDTVYRQAHCSFGRSVQYAGCLPGHRGRGLCDRGR